MLQYSLQLFFMWYKATARSIAMETLLMPYTLACLTNSQYQMSDDIRYQVILRSLAYKLGGRFAAHGDDLNLLDLTLCHWLQARYNE
jgi:hypothetical protein